MRNVNIRVTNEAQSKFVQEALFATGCRWASGDVKPILRSGYCDTIITVDHLGIMFSTDTVDHEGRTHIELEPITTYKFVDNRPKLTISNKEYLVEDIERALKANGVNPL